MALILNMVKMIVNNRPSIIAATGFFCKLNKQYLILLVFFLALPLSNAYAVEAISFDTILKNLKISSDSVFKLTTAISYALGFWFMIAALMDLKQHGQSSGGQGSGISGPLIKFFVGVALVYLPGTMSSTIATFWGAGTSIIAYDPGTDIMATFKLTAIAIVQLIGLISFISGFVGLAHSSDQGAQPGAVAKGILRVFAGMLAVNVVATIKVFEVTFGISIL